MMFGGMFDAVVYPQEVAKKNEELRRKEEARKKYEENMDKPITITQRQFMEISARVMARGKFMSMAKQSDPEMGAILMLAMTPVMADLTSELFADGFVEDMLKEEEK